MVLQVEPIISAVNAQITQYFRSNLPTQLTLTLANRRRTIRNRDAIDLQLSWPARWSQPPLEAETTTVSDDSNEETPPSEVAPEVEIAHRVRLSSASFGDVLRTMRVWADSVERHPDAYRDLIEDRLSDLLCGTLNAALPGANREVYTRSGKADILVRADVLREGLGPAVVYVCEAKWWTSLPKAVEALDQLLGYTEAKDTAATLIFFIRTRNGGSVRSKIVDALTRRDDCVRRGDELIDGWPVLEFKSGEAVLRIAVAFVDLPPTRRSSRSRSSRTRNSARPTI
jgi:hypothetical protein